MTYNKVWVTENRKLNNVELIKLKKDGLDIIQTIVDKYSKEGFTAVSDEDRILLKWAGIYDQRPKNGHYMMRVRINSGIMNTKQARVIADISHKFGKDIIKITTRGSIQLYWITLEQLPEIFRELSKVNLSTFEACGDCPRTIVGNPLSGIDPHELIDTTALVDQLNDFFLLNRNFSNLPRKFKISVSSSISNAAHREINDLSFSPAIKSIDGEEVIGFNVWIGGGLSTKPILAKQLDIFVRPDEVLKVTEGTAIIFRDHGYRESRQHARLKFLVDDWGSDKFKAELLNLTGSLPEQGTEMISEWNGAYFYGIHPQKQTGKSYIGLNVPLGHMDSAALYEFAELADRYGDSKLRTTLSQNIILSGIDNSAVPELLEEPIFTNYPPENFGFIGQMVVCTGSEFCNLALVETKERAKSIAEFLDNNINDVKVRINMAGCPNSCGHTQIADIGLRGSRIKTESGSIEAFDIFIGGELGPEARFNTKLSGRISAERLNKLLLALIAFYKDNRTGDEDFDKFANRVGIEPFQNIMNQHI